MDTGQEQRVEPLELSQDDRMAEAEAEQRLQPEPEATAEPSATPGKDRPRVALMGEFSAGKSTLSNLLLGRAAVPVNVTATQLPPVWLSYGEDAPFTVDLNGDEHPLDLENLEEVSVKGTNHIRIFHTSERLQEFDLIDMPGISDPNMAADVWQRVIHNANVVIWCSHATQAWRQSEAAVWSTMPEALYQRSILLLTRMDRILSERDRMRVIKRVESETKGLFREVLPVSLIRALESEPGTQAWAESGADDLLELLGDLVDEVASSGDGGRRNSVLRPRPKTRRPSTRNVAPVEEEAPAPEKPKPARIVMPTRVRPRPLQS